MFRGIAVTLFFTFAIVVSGCGTKAQYEVIFNGETLKQAEEQENIENLDKYKIGIVSKIRGISYFYAVEEGVIEAGEDLGVEVIFRGPSDATWESQKDVIEEMIAKDVDVLAIAANDPSKLGSALQKARDQGIKVITWDSDTDPEFREFYINMLDPEILGRHLMDSLALRTEEIGNYIILTGSASSANLNDWIEWIRVQNEEYYPNLKLLDIIPTDEDHHKAYTTALQVIEEYPNLTGIIAISTINPPAVAEALKFRNKEGDIVLIGTTTPNLIREYVKDDTVHVNTLWSPQKLGYLTVSLAKDLLDGTLPYDGQNIPKNGNIRVIGDTVIMGLPLDFTKENVDQYDF
ncbi:autoinducer 2 ABC transporter substrate-binding protein [Halalkalibacter lacteus]|uniref:autoinducer 2 ABC transporter substrate-binding protein n=1 Tax=Halalkalibacter lacteus TaxID=3090663 RepID=UPI002FC8EA19